MICRGRKIILFSLLPGFLASTPNNKRQINQRTVNRSGLTCTPHVHMGNKVKKWGYQRNALDFRLNYHRSDTERGMGEASQVDKSKVCPKDLS
jgi:hypothetical protein